MQLGRHLIFFMKLAKAAEKKVAAIEKKAASTEILVHQAKEQA